MNQLTDGRKVIQPTSVEKMKPGQRFEASGEWMRDVRTNALDWIGHPDAYMRSRGYHANPATCIHHRKKFRTRWVCSDCGTLL